MAAERVTLPPSLLKLMEERETANERFISYVRLSIGAAILSLHFIISAWRFRDYRISPGVYVIDIFLIIYGLTAIPYLQRAVYHPARKYIMVAADVVLTTVMFVIIRRSMDMPIVTFIFLYPQLVIIAGCGLRYEPRLVIFGGSVTAAAFLAYLGLTDGVVPFLIAGLIFIAAVTVVSYYVGMSLQRLTVEALRQSRLTRFFSPDALREITSREEAGALGGVSTEATVLFADIRGFTTISEKNNPDAVVKLLNEYFSEMVEAIFSHRGMLDKFIGDAVMAVFGAPVRSANHAGDALAAAREMLSRLDALNARRALRGEEPIRIGIGIHTGPVILGNIGSARRMDYTVIGDAVNVAARLQPMTKEIGMPVVISSATFERLEGVQGCLPVGKVAVRGRESTVSVFGVGS